MIPKMKKIKLCRLGTAYVNIYHVAYCDNNRQLYHTKNKFSRKSGVYLTAGKTDKKQ